MPPVEQILGPYGATILLAAAVVGFGRVIQVLWRDHLQGDAEAAVRETEWKKLAIDSQRDMARLTKAVEAALDIKVPPAS